jgi:hypothetical protein
MGLCAGRRGWRPRGLERTGGAGRGRARAAFPLGDPGRIAGLRVEAGATLAQRLDAAPADDTALLDRARAAIARMAHWGLATAPLPPSASVPPPEPGHVLVIDEPAGRARRDDIRELLFIAAEEHPGHRLIVVAPGGGQLRDGDLGAAERAPPGVALPDLLAGARAVWTVARRQGSTRSWRGTARRDGRSRLRRPRADR